VSPDIPTVSFPGMIQSSPTSIRVPATRSTPLPCTRRHRGHSSKEASRIQAEPSIRCLRIGLFAGLYQIQALLELAKQRGERLSLLRGEAGDYFLLLLQESRDQPFITRTPFSS